jgi:hypothetical protein
MLLSKLFFDILGLRQFPTKKTKSEELKDLINILKPVATNKNLIRFGSSTDGGYLIPDDLDGISACFSPGVADCVSFETCCAARGIKVFLADHSVDQLPAENQNFHFVKKFIGSNTNENFIRLDEWVTSSNIDGSSDLILQMDIEGFEYETLISSSDELMKRFRILIIECHGMHNLWNLPFFKLARAAFQRVLQYHSCVHIHPNNARGTTVIEGIEIPKLLEFTFYRKERFKPNDQKLTFPHLLDSDNTRNRHIPLPKCWQP